MINETPIPILSERLVNLAKELDIDTRKKMLADNYFSQIATQAHEILKTAAEIYSAALEMAEEVDE